MEDDTTRLTTEAPVSPTAIPSGPVMDIIPPPATAARPVSANTQPDLATAPAEAPAETVPANQVTSQSKETIPDEPKTQPKPAATPAKPREPRTTPVVAIVVSILLFLVLAGLAYYAYSKG
jgi:hypothetical protein